jgi:TolB-like protein
MDVAREDRIELLFEQALAIAPGERQSFLDQACADDPALRSELEGLLASAGGARDFARGVAGAIVARWMDYVLRGPVGATDPRNSRRAIKLASSVRHSRERWTRLLLVLSGAVAIIVGVLFAVSRSRPRGDTPIRSVAVLLSAELSPDTVRQAIADELASLLIDRIAHVGDVRVSSRSSVLPYRATRKSSRQIGRELGVDGLIQMSILRDDTRARINVSLISARGEHVVWSQTFEGSLSDVKSLEREVAEAVTREVQRRGQ